jgi:hypothetical protein
MAPLVTAFGQKAHFASRGFRVPRCFPAPFPPRLPPVKYAPAGGGSQGQRPSYELRVANSGSSGRKAETCPPWRDRNAEPQRTRLPASLKLRRTSRQRGYAGQDAGQAQNPQKTVFLSASRERFRALFVAVVKSPVCHGPKNLENLLAGNAPVSFFSTGRNFRSAAKTPRSNGGTMFLNHTETQRRKEALGLAADIDARLSLGAAPSGARREASRLPELRQGGRDLDGLTGRQKASFGEAGGDPEAHG